MEFFTAKRPVYFLDFSSGTLKIEVASTDFTSPNGITHNEDSSELYVVDTFQKHIGILTRDLQSEKLTKVEFINSIHQNDNIKYDKET